MRFDVHPMYRSYIRYIHKLRIDVITYVPTLANDPSSAAVCLLPLLYRTVAVPAVPGIPPGVATSVHQRTFYCMHRYGLLRFDGGFVGWDPSWPGIILWRSAVVERVTAAALGRPQKFHRKVPGRSQQESADDGCGPAGVIEIFKMSFWRII